MKRVMACRIIWPWPEPLRKVPQIPMDLPTVQACRPEDRAMLETPAGQELLRCALDAMRNLK